MNIILPSLTAVLLCALPVYGQKKSPTNKRSAVETREMLASRIDPYFLGARKKFDTGKPEACAADLGKASAKMRKLAAGSTLSAVEGVNTSAADLDELAGLVTKGELSNGAKLDEAFALAHQRMAKFQHAKAEALLAEKKNMAAGRAMNRVADHVEHATKWAGGELDAPQNAVVGSLRKVAGGLVSGTGTVVEGAGTVLKKSLGLITGLGEKIKGEAKPSSGNLGKDAVEGTRKVTGGAVKGVGKAGETGAGAVEKTGGGLKKVGDKVSGKEDSPE